MLRPEQAKEMLEQFQNKEIPKRRIDAVDKLSGKLKTLGYALLGRDNKGAPFTDWMHRAKLLNDAAKPLEELSAKERLKIWTALFPQMAPIVEGAWQLRLTLPYQEGYARKAFRAPRQPALYRTGRMQWIGNLILALEFYDPDILWCATWAAHLNYFATGIGTLCAAAIEAGGKQGEEVFQLLRESATGEHAIGAMGRHVTQALLCASKPEGWEFIEKMLLAAQRQEGLRQTILESIDEAHPEAFLRMLKLIQEENLTRFSATVRAVNVWFGYMWDSVSAGVVNKVLERVQNYFDDPKARDKAIASGEPEDAYLALWTLAFTDVGTALAPAAKLLKDKKVERRFVGVQLLGQMRTLAATEHMLAALADDDLRIVLKAWDHLSFQANDNEEEEQALAQKLLQGQFERLEKLLPRLPEEKTTLKPLVWPWTAYVVDKTSYAHQLPRYLQERPAARLLPYLPQMNADGRHHVVRAIAQQKKSDAATREALFTFVGDASPSVREEALKVLKTFKITTAEAQGLEQLLTRKAGDLRRGVLALLLEQQDAAAFASADRLLQGDAPQRLAGLELLRLLADAGREPIGCKQRADTFAQRAKVSKEETKLLELLQNVGRKVDTLEDALGLITDPSQRTQPPPPRKLQVQFNSTAAAHCLESLDALIHEHRETPLHLDKTNPEAVTLLGNAGWQFPDPLRDFQMNPELPLQELWERWWAERGPDLRDEDGWELLRAWHMPKNSTTEQLHWSLYGGFGGAVQEGDDTPVAKAYALLLGQVKPKLRYREIVCTLLHWLLQLHPPKGGLDFLLDAVETAFALIPPEELIHVKKNYQDPHWRDEHSPFSSWLHHVRLYLRLAPKEWQNPHYQRFWHLLRWADEPGVKIPRNRPQLLELGAALQAGGATVADLYDQLLGPRNVPEDGSYSYYANYFGELRDLTSRHPYHEGFRRLQAMPVVREAVDRCRQRILEVELARGETPTVATGAALSLESVLGLEWLIRLLVALGKNPLKHGSYWSGQGKAPVFGYLIEHCYPLPEDTPERFAAQIKEADVPETRLVELAIFAPQWAPHVGPVLGWPEFTEAVWWVLAHTRDRSLAWNQERQGQIAQFTPLSVEDLMDGAVDVAWFHRVYLELGPKRWQAIYAAAKFATKGAGHKRAQLFADAMLGKVKRKELLDGIEEKRQQDAVRALGLLPLAKGSAAVREKDLLERYQVLQEFLRTSKQFGSQRQASEKRAGTIGMENLARTAGYPDPIRLEWALEAKAVADLAAGPVRVTVDGVTVSLALDLEGQAEISVLRGDKPLKTVPPAVKKDPQVAELFERKTDLKRQASRMRQSLETAMVRGDPFTGSELQELMQHPLLARFLARLVLLGEGILGYPENNGKVLRDHAGKLEPVKKEERFRIAHPVDLLATHAWDRWQHDCFQREVMQPFKQVFRELYVLTQAEQTEGRQSRRYAGHQVNPRQALALLTARGWISHDGVQKTFHDAGIIAAVQFLNGIFTPAEVEGLTLESILFYKKGNWHPLPLTEVPPRLFSEVMRDLDLVVSVAHRGGVDPEASASTVEMRAALLRETCQLLKITNIRIKEPHVLIDGDLANYSIHLGSANVHRLPGGSLCILPVHAQHRGRLFLPFADDDPKTAEVISKTLLLARDREIQDPGILEQLRR
jgi:hypothetical protein